MDAFELGARHLQAARLGARGEQHPVEAKVLAVRSDHLAGFRVDPRDRSRGAELDVVVLIETLGVHVRLLPRRLAAEVVLLPGNMPANRKVFGGMQMGFPGITGSSPGFG
jgi:hypothetical protein